MTRNNKSIAVLHQICFSLALGFAILGSLLPRGLVPPPWPFGPVQEMVSQAYRQPGGLLLGSGIAFLVAGGLWGLCISLMLTVLARHRFTEAFLRSGAGIAALAVPWICWWFMTPGYPLVAYLGLGVMTAWATVFIVYLQRRFGRLTWQSAVVIACHYGFWGWLFRRSIAHPVGLLIPGMLFLSCVMWTSVARHKKDA
jgi:hypothetical protein